MSEINRANAEGEIGVSDVHFAVANFILLGIADHEELSPLKAKGVYYGDGRMEINYLDYVLEIDPARYYPRDPKRCIDAKDTTWSQFRVKSCLLDSSTIRKKG